MTAATAPRRKSPDPREEAVRLDLMKFRLRKEPFDKEWASMRILKSTMNDLGWFLSMRDRGDGIHFDVCWFWAKDWRRTGMEHGLLGSEVEVAYAAAVKGLSAPVPE